MVAQFLGSHVIVVVLGWMPLYRELLYDSVGRYSVLQYPKSLPTLVSLINLEVSKTNLHT